MHPAWIEIDLAQFRRNIATIRHHIGTSLLCLPVKANAYGHGLIPMSKAAAEAGVDYLAVSCLQEGTFLRQAGVQLPILVLGAIHEEQIDDLLHYNLELTLSSKLKADLVAKRNPQKPVRVHLEVDTGMHRTGVRPSTAIALYHHLKTLGCFDIVGLYSHLASAEHSDDPIAIKQIDAFQNLLQHFQEPLLCHIAASSSLVHFPSAHRQMVRPGLLAFGYPPKNAPPSYQTIAPCFSLKAKISYFKVVASNQGISYGHTYTTSKQTRIVTIPIGYGDGYLRALSNRSSVLIRGKRFPIAGTICMDQFMVDIGDHTAHVGDEVVLIGKQDKEEITLAEIAHLAETIPYEILCLFNERLPRIYTEQRD